MSRRPDEGLCKTGLADGVSFLHLALSKPGEALEISPPRVAFQELQHAVAGTARMTAGREEVARFSYPSCPRIPTLGRRRACGQPSPLRSSPIAP